VLTQRVLIGEQVVGHGAADDGDRGVTLVVFFVDEYAAVHRPVLGDDEVGGGTGNAGLRVGITRAHRGAGFCFRHGSHHVVDARGDHRVVRGQRIGGAIGGAPGVGRAGTHYQQIGTHITDAF